MQLFGPFLDILIALTLCYSDICFSVDIIAGCPSLLSIKVNKSTKNIINATAIPECFCDRDAKRKVVINCVHLTNLDSLTNALKSVKAVRGNSLKEISIQNINLTKSDPSGVKPDLPDDYFVDFKSDGKNADQQLMNLESLSLQNCHSKAPIFGPNGLQGIDKSLKSFKMVNCGQMSKLPEAVTRMTSLENLEIRQSNLSSISKENVAQPALLKILDLSNQLINWNKTDLSSFKNLSVLKLSETGSDGKVFNRINPLINLQKLDLSRNNIKRLPDNSFNVFKVLKDLNLNFNHIQRLNDSALNGLGKLESLDLRNNFIRDIGPKSFSNLTSLKQLLLAGNYIANLSKGHFESSKKLEQLDLSQNGLTSVDKDTFAPLRNLNKLNLDKNKKLKGLDKSIFDTLTALKSLNLSYTNLSESLNKNFFASKPKLELLDLSGLNATKLDKDLFATTTSLISLFLRSNNLSTVDSTQFRSLKKLKLLDLSDNPWICDDRIKTLVDFLKSLVPDSSTKSAFLQLLPNEKPAVCFSPVKLAGVPLGAVKIDNGKEKL